MIKRSTWLMLVLFGLVIAGYFLFRGRISTIFSVPTPTAINYNYLITQTDGTLENLRIYDNNYHATQMQRDTSGTWFISQPKTGPADQSLAGAAETQVGALKVLTTLNSQLNLKDIGLDFPSYTMKLAFSSGKQHIIEVGISTPTGSGYYVRFDEGSIYVISKDGIDALVNLVTSPPYPATETPIPTLESTVTYTPATSTAVPVTPTP
jgi:hypothetical protein